MDPTPLHYEALGYRTRSWLVGGWFHIPSRLWWGRRRLLCERTCFQGKCLTAAKAKVTAGFMCAPEMCPTAYIITVTISPPATDAPSFEMSPSFLTLIAAEPHVTKTNRNVAIVSAITYMYETQICLNTPLAKVASPIYIFIHFQIAVYT